jgi:hypothetical protein
MGVFLMSGLEIFFLGLASLLGVLCLYLMAHVNEEQKTGTYIPLIWERDYWKK